MWELKSKKTSKVFIVNSDVYEELKGNGQIKKYIVTKLPDPVVKKIIPEEIVTKKTGTKKETDQK